MCMGTGIGCFESGRGCGGGGFVWRWVQIGVWVDIVSDLNAGCTAVLLVHVLMAVVGAVFRDREVFAIKIK